MSATSWGATVRDAFLGAESPDVDLATDARPSEVRSLVEGWADHVWLQGERFGTVGAEYDGQRLEITTYRGDVYRPDSRKPTVAFADRIEDDLARRDFTINAMALRLPDPVLVDPRGGATDLAARCLRTPESPEVSFEADPLRMLRAARFVAAFQLEPVPDLVAAIGALRARLEIVSPRARARRAVPTAGGAGPHRGVLAALRDAPRRRIPPRTQRLARRAGPDSPPQRRPGPHAGGGRQTPTRRI